MDSQTEAVSWAILLDLDDTLVLTRPLESLRRNRKWPQVYAQFGRTALPHGTPEFVAQLKSLGTVAVVTTSPRAYATRLLQYHEIDVPVLVAYHDVSHHKPHPEPMLKAATALGIPPQKCISVGDTKADHDAAIAAGAHSVLVRWEPSVNATEEHTLLTFCADWRAVLQQICTCMESEE